jgi:hypothetical protein
MGCQFYNSKQAVFRNTFLPYRIIFFFFSNVLANPKGPILLATFFSLSLNQGDQIGQMYAYWAIVYTGQFFVGNYGSSPI